MLDASSLRRQVGRQAAVINRIASTMPQEELPLLRERMGHTGLEIVAGVLTGIAVAYAVLVLL
jgi:acid phosphatase family membrane protein YuiD